MKMMKYEFANVLVADTRLLMNMSEPENYPRVLVLNNQLNETCPQYHQNNHNNHNQRHLSVHNSVAIAATKQSSCFNCCLRIEEPEFKKRANLDEDSERQCFANCSERRLVNIELNTDSQIHGKLVLLALTRGLPNALMLEGSVSLKCQTETSWFYSLFDQPQQVNHPDRAAAAIASRTTTTTAITNTNTLTNTHSHTSNTDTTAGSSRQQAQLTYYSRLKSNQMANLRIGSVEINWNNQLRREVISIDIHSNRLRKHQQMQRVHTNETLLVSELSCRSSSPIDSVNWLGKIHLLALINREVNHHRPVAPSVVSSSSSSSSGISNTILTTGNKRKDSPQPPLPSPPSILLKATATATRKLDLDQPVTNGDKPPPNTSKRDTIIQPPPRPPPPSTTLSSSSSSSSSTSLNANNDDRRADESQNSIDIDRRSEGILSLSSSPSSSSFPFLSHNTYNQSSSFMIDGGIKLAAAVAEGVEVGVGIGGGNTNVAASGNKWTDLNQLRSLDGLGESIRMRLKSSSFLLFTVSSSFVILAYTLCLLIYLKGRKKPISVRSRRLSAQRRPNQTQQQSEQQNTGQTDQQEEQQQEQPMCISEPYNLQMPEPTRTRLEMMLRTTKRKADVATQNGRGAIRQHLLDSSAATATAGERRSRKRRRATSTGMIMGYPVIPAIANHNFVGSTSGCESFVGEQQHDNDDDEPFYHIASNGNSAFSDSEFGYGTLQVVRAIRQAAAVARFRLGSSRYEPNLNVIHESDLEHLQHSASSSCKQTPSGSAAAAAATSTVMDKQQHKLFDSEQDKNISHQSRVASQIDHLVQDALNLECSHFIERIQQPSATLFSRPIEDLDGSPSGEGHVSRSGILKLVKFADKK